MKVILEIIEVYVLSTWIFSLFLLGGLLFCPTQFSVFGWSLGMIYCAIHFTLILRY